MTAVAGKYRARMWAAGLACLLSVLTVGCSEIHYFAGVTPVTAALETKLQPGKSTPAKVTAVLGKPTGRGGIMLPVLDKRARETWSYYFEKGYVKAGQGGSMEADSRRIFLFVYFDKGVYDGYLWFSSLPNP